MVKTWDVNSMSVDVNAPLLLGPFEEILATEIPVYMYRRSSISSKNIAFSEISYSTGSFAFCKLLAYLLFFFRIFLSSHNALHSSELKSFKTHVVIIHVKIVHFHLVSL